jgi:hypothetical protein
MKTPVGMPAVQQALHLQQGQQQEPDEEQEPEPAVPEGWVRACDVIPAEAESLPWTELRDASRPEDLKPVRRDDPAMADIRAQIEKGIGGAAAETSRSLKETPPAKRPPQSAANTPSIASGASGSDRSGRELVRGYLAEIGRARGLPVPDNALVDRVMELGNGSTAEAVYLTLRKLHEQQRFRDMKSWGLIPFVLSPYFTDAEALA